MVTEARPNSPSRRIASEADAGGEALLNRERWIGIVRILAIASVVGLYARGWLPAPALWGAVAVGLYPLLRTGIEDLRDDHLIGTELFVSVATLIALVGGQPIAGAILMTIILIAEFIADLNTDRARASIRNLIGSVPTVALVRRPEGDVVLPLDDVRRGDVVLIRAGDRVPVDGRVVVGDGAVDESPITGESVPKDKGASDPVFAGTVLQWGALDVETELVGADTTFARIVALVEEAEDSKAPVQRLADRVAAWLIPLMVVFLVVVFVVTRDVRTVVGLMVFTSPAELALATPMVVIAGIARAARNGILLKGGVFLERLAHVDTIVFDKTGTLTVGRPSVQAVRLRSASLDEREVLRLAAAADRRSSHPVAEAIVSAATASGVEIPEPDAFEVVQGRGVVAAVEGRRLVLGNAAHLAAEGIPLPPSEFETVGTIIHLAAEDQLLASIELADELRPDAKRAIERLRASGIDHVAMLTGDNAATANAVAAQLGIDEVFADLLPDDKLTAIRRLQADGRKVAMVGDGINDAPALAQADVGIAMGVGGTQAAIEAADVALMTDDIGRIVTARAIARSAYNIIKQNLFFGVGVVHVLGIIAVLLGYIGPIEAAIIHMGPDVLVFLNSTRLLNANLHDR